MGGGSTAKASLPGRRSTPVRSGMTPFRAGSPCGFRKKEVRNFPHFRQVDAEAIGYPDGLIQNLKGFWNFRKFR